MLELGLLYKSVSDDIIPDLEIESTSKTALTIILFIFAAFDF